MVRQQEEALDGGEEGQAGGKGEAGGEGWAGGRWEIRDGRGRKL